MKSIDQIIRAKAISPNSLIETRNRAQAILVARHLMSNGEETHRVTPNSKEIILLILNCSKGEEHQKF